MALSGETVVLAFAQIGMILPFTGVVGVDKVRLGSGRWDECYIWNWTSVRCRCCGQLYEMTDDFGDNVSCASYD